MVKEWKGPAWLAFGIENWAAAYPRINFISLLVQYFVFKHLQYLLKTTNNVINNISDCGIWCTKEISGLTLSGHGQ